MDKNHKVENDCAEVEVVDGSVSDLAKSHYKVQIEELSSLGMAGAFLQRFLQSGVKPGGEGLYRVTFPKGFKGTLSTFKDENAFLGSGIKDGKMTQARLRQVSFDPTETFMAIALMNIQHQISEISAVQHEMLNLMYAQEESKLTGNLTFLDEMLDDYKLNWNDRQYVDHNLTEVIVINNDAIKSAHLFKSQINDIMSMPNLPHLMTSANKCVSKLQHFLHNYRLSVFTYSYSIYVEILLRKKFDRANIEQARKKITQIADEYNEFSQRSLEWGERYIRESLDYAAAPLYRGADKGYEKLLKHMPFEFDKLYASDHDKYLSAEDQIHRSDLDKKSGTIVFQSALDEIDMLEQKAVSIYIKGNNIYIPCTTMNTANGEQ